MLKLELVGSLDISPLWQSIAILADHKTERRAMMGLRGQNNIYENINRGRRTANEK
jgi:hypothetical protein